MDKSQIERLETAMFSPAFPCNPRPFANGLAELLMQNPCEIQSKTAKRILYILMAQAYGQCSTIDLNAEYDNLKLEVKAHEQI